MLKIRFARVGFVENMKFFAHQPHTAKAKGAIKAIAAHQYVRRPRAANRSHTVRTCVAIFARVAVGALRASIAIVAIGAFGTVGTPVAKHTVTTVVALLTAVGTGIFARGRVLSLKLFERFGKFAPAGLHGTPQVALKIAGSTMARDERLNRRCCDASGSVPHLSKPQQAGNVCVLSHGTSWNLNNSPW